MACNASGQQAKSLAVLSHFGQPSDSPKLMLRELARPEALTVFLSVQTEDPALLFWST